MEAASNTVCSSNSLPHQLQQQLKNKDNIGILISVIDDPQNEFLGYDKLSRVGAVAAGGGQDSFRAHSLNRLDSMTKASCSDSCYIFKCPSFPGLDRYLSISARTISTTHLETGSMTPRISTVTLSQDLDREAMTLLGLSTNFVTPLTRSTSARNLHFLSTILICEENRKSMTGLRMRRSTSCPSFGCIQHVICANSERRGGVINSYLLQDRDVDLTGEEVGDLPIDPRINFPDFDPDTLEEEPISKTLLCNQLISHTISLSSSLPSSTYVDHDSSFRDFKMAAPITCSNMTTPVKIPKMASRGSGEWRSAREKNKDYVNIGDIPSSIAEKVISDCHHCRQRSPHLVEIKCLQWLNSIGNNR